MLLSSLLKDVEVINEYDDCEIKDICCSTNHDVENSAFVCIKGKKHNGNDYLKLAIRRGAAAVITDDPQQLASCVVVRDARKAYALMCKEFYGNPQEGMKLVATTGTNGKTSVTSIVTAILNKADVSCGSITTINACFKDYVGELSNTTPDSHTLYKTIAEMGKRGCEAICLEASSHALAQKRLAGLRFDVSVFTNLTEDHLDYHSDMEEYYQAKKLLFSIANCAVVNVDDPYGRRLCNEVDVELDTYSVSDPDATYYADEIVYNSEGVSFRINHDSVLTRISFKIPGVYSVMNVLAATAVARRLGVSFDTIALAVSEIDGIMGRNEIIKTDRDFTILCDFAHTPDGLLSIIKSTKEYAKGRIIVVFGCGGDRDREKRPLMGRVATENADVTVITSDNPRSENKVLIINDILRGVKNEAKYIAIEERSEAIRYAISIARKNDIIILAGKGHELYQQVGDTKLLYDERKVVKGILSSSLELSE